MKLSREYLQVLVDEIYSTYKVDSEITSPDGTLIAGNKKKVPKIPDIEAGDKYVCVKTPIILEERCLGYLYTSGDEDVNKEILKIIMLSIKTSIQYEMNRDHASKTRDEELFLRNLISGNSISDDEVIREWGNQSGYDINMPRSAIVIELIPKRAEHFNINLGYENSIDDMRRIIRNEVKNNKYINNQDLVLVYNDEYILVLKSFFDMLDKDRKYKALDRICNSIYDDIADNKLFQISIAYGRLVDKLSNIRLSYTDSIEILDLSKQIDNSSGVFSIQDFIFEDLVYNMNEYLLDKFIRPIAACIMAAEKRLKIDICRTINFYIECNCSVSDTAKKLYLHRNSILLRLNKISKITGLDIINNTSHLFLLKLVVTYISINPPDLH
jgi:hypothetical protein